MKNVSEFIKRVDTYLAALGRWTKAELASNEFVKQGRDAAKLNATVPDMAAECKAAQKAVLAAVEGLPKTLEAAGVDCRELLKFRKLVFDGLDTPGMANAWRTLRADLERMEIPKARATVSAGGVTRRRGKRGPIKKHDAVADAKLARDWTHASKMGTYKADFARERGFSLKDFDRLLNRVRKAKS